MTKSCDTLQEEIDDEMERSLIICILKRYSRFVFFHRFRFLYYSRSITEALDHVSLVEQELEFLSMDRTKELSAPLGPPKKPFILTVVG